MFNINFLAPQTPAVIFVYPRKKRRVEFVNTTKIFLKKITINGIGNTLKWS